MKPNQLLTQEEISHLALTNGYDPASLKAVLEVESAGHGFSSVTGKIIIQFEPAWFKRKALDWQKHNTNTIWQNNGISNQAQEWLAFNDAWKVSPDAAMQSTSIGLPQIMGFHYRLLGFKQVGEMWDFAKVSEANQVAMMIKFIKANPKLDTALKNDDWGTFAYIYNGAGYKELAARTKTMPYDKRLAVAKAQIIKEISNNA